MVTHQINRIIAALASVPAVAAAERPLSVLDPAGPAAAAIAAVWWWMFWGSLLLLALVCALALHAMWRNAESPAPISSRLLVLGGGLVLPVTVITALLFHGVRSGDAMLPHDVGVEPFRVEVTARQWWWAVRYPDVGGSALYDANEIHIPHGRPIDIVLKADDVIHSFWVPRLGGKLDAIPGKTNTLRLQADSPGIYRGMCAEFCGAQHARMGFHLIVLEEEELQRVLAQRAAIRPDPFSEAAAVFERHCAQCHSTNGRDGVPDRGPNLAAAGQRRHLVAGWLRNDPGQLRRWLEDHQTIKPGNHMRDLSHIDPNELDTIAAWLEGR